MKYYPECRNKLEGSPNFCYHCGAKLSISSNPFEKIKKTPCQVFREKREAILIIQQIKNKK